MISLKRQLQQKHDIFNKLLRAPTVERKASFVEVHNPKIIKLQHQNEKDISEQNIAITHKHKETKSTEKKNQRRRDSKWVKRKKFRKIKKKMRALKERKVLRMTLNKASKQSKGDKLLPLSVIPIGMVLRSMA